MTIGLRADMAELGRLNEWIDAAAKALHLGDKKVYALRLCIEEVVGNVILHGHPAPDSAAITVAIEGGGRRDGDPLTLTIEDDGAMFDPTGVAEPATFTTLDKAPVGGLGLKLVRRFARSLTYNRVAGRNRLAIILS